MATGCRGLDTLRDFFHPDEAPQGTGGNAAIHLRIKPAEKLQIFLDGSPVATASPYSARHLKPGRHQLYLEAENYHPFALVFQLKEGIDIKLPIAMRPLDKDGSTTSEPAPDSGSARVLPVGSRGPALPHGIAPVSIQLSATPAVTVEVDGQSIADGVAHLRNAWGSVTAGELHFEYRFNEVGLLEIHIPYGTGRWLKNSHPFKAGTAFRLTGGKVSLLYEESQQNRQSITVKRR